MKLGVKSHCHKSKKVLAVTALTILAASGIFGLTRQIWADSTEMTRLQFGNVLFCQRMSEAINDSLGHGKADGSDCTNFNLSVSTAAIGNIQTLNIVPPPNGFGDIDFDTQPISINGTWVDEFYNLNSLSITNMHVRDISPLQYIESDLTYLDLSNNQIYDIEPLAQFEDVLEYLDLSGNPVSSGLRNLSYFSHLTTLKLANTGVTYFDDLFRPVDIYIDTNNIRYDDQGGVTYLPIYKADTIVYDDETGEILYGEQLSKIPLSSTLAKVLRNFDISNNESLSNEKNEYEYLNECDGNLIVFKNYPQNPNIYSESYARFIETPQNLAINNLNASKDSLNSDDLICIANLVELTNLDVSGNHIEDFVSIKNKTYSSLKADSQVFTRSIEELDYSPLPDLFDQASQTNYFSNIPSATNIAISQNSLMLTNARFNGSKVRFINAAIASPYDENPQPATVTIPSGSGVFENSKLQIYFDGQVVTFNDTNLCNSIYRQGTSTWAFTDAEGYPSIGGLPVVLTNACDQPKKQIAMISGGSSLFRRLTLDNINNGAIVDLTGLDEFFGLQVLSLQNDGLSDLSKISGLGSLQQLWLNKNNLENDDWSIITDSLYGLKILSLNYNNMNEIPSAISNLYGLGNLYLVDNGISDVSPLAYVPSITALDLSENSNITEISSLVQENTACNPSVLKIENAGITELPSANQIARGFSNLTSLNLNSNQITSSTISNLSQAPRLGELYLENNRITDTTGFRGITTLSKLFLDNNQINNVSGLASLTGLVELHLKNNQISTIASLNPNTLTELATFNLNNQTLTGSISNAEEAYPLPAIFSQAKTSNYPKVEGFRSEVDFQIANGSINYDTMMVTMTDTSVPMTVTIPDGSLTGTKITITYAGQDEGFSGNLIDYTNSGATTSITSNNSFTVTSNRACMAIWSPDNGNTWNRLAANTTASSDTRSFTLDQNGLEIIIAYIGDANSDNKINIGDARKIINAITGRDTLSSLQAKLADANNSNSINVSDARAIINSLIGRGAINW
ncbi:hypothetical protein IKF20_01975 [Candidatus Saccharibacteria bacterium]|nr:hypothetical protein [Candidatus Saccharibacteria bacterium]